MSSVLIQRQNYGWFNCSEVYDCFSALLFEFTNLTMQTWNVFIWRKHKPQTTLRKVTMLDGQDLIFSRINSSLHISILNKLWDSPRLPFARNCNLLAAWGQSGWSVRLTTHSIQSWSLAAPYVPSCFGLISITFLNVRFFFGGHHILTGSEDYPRVQL
jgi:hypothetical protein